MLTVVSIVLDVLAVILIIVPLVRGYKKGFKRCMLSIVSLLTAAAVAYITSGLFADAAYEKFARKPVHNICLSAVSEYDPVVIAQKTLAKNGIEVTEQELKDALSQAGNIMQTVKSIAEYRGMDEQTAQELGNKISGEAEKQLPKAVNDAMPKPLREIFKIDLDDAQTFDAVQAAADSPQKAADYVEKNCAEPICIAIIKSAIFVVVFIIMQLVMLLVFKIFGFDLKAGAKSGGDRAGGVAIALINSAANVIVLCLFVSALELSSGGLFEVDRLTSYVFLPIFKLLYGG